MALNELNLFFGPKMPIEFETVGLAFVAAPVLRSDSAIGVLSAIRYAKENYDHVEQLNIFDRGVAGSQLAVEYSSANFTAFETNQGGFAAQGRVPLLNEYWGPQLLNSALRVSGMRITPADTWYPLIQPGIVFRPGYIIAASGIEPSGSWLKRAVDPLNANNQDFLLTLIYSIPETLYSVTTTGNFNLSFPPTQAAYKLTKEIATPTGPHTIGYEGTLDILNSIKVNGTVRASGLFTNNFTGSGDAFIKSIDKDLKHIVLRSSIAPDDLVEIQYYSYNDHYVYTGFRDVSGTWWPFDANPEYGHIIGDDAALVLSTSADALLNQITLYAIPSAAIVYSFIESSEEDTVGTLILTAHRAIDYGETHFVRHLISNEPVELLNTRDSGTVLNTWGHAVLGRNFYDEVSNFGGDIFNLRVPSMIPLGRFVLGAPAAVDSVSLADIRERGGGVPLDFPMTAVTAQEDGLDNLKSFFDMGIWEGKAVKEGGVVEVQIDLSLLKTDPNDTDPTTFLASEIYDLVRSQVPPGIDFEIRYVENL